MTELFEGNSRIEVIEKAAIAAALLPLLDEIQARSPGVGEDALKQTDVLVADFIHRLELLGFQLRPNIPDAQILDNLSTVIELFEEGAQKPL